MRHPLFHHAGFFVFRVPLLSRRALEDLKSPTLGSVPAGRANSGATALHAWWGHVPLRNAISLQSPSLAEAVSRCLGLGARGPGAPIDLPLYRYLGRSAVRGAPRGLFAAAGLGRITSTTALEFGGPSRSILIDLALDYLSSLLRDALRLQPLPDGVRLLVNPMLSILGISVSVWETSGIGAARKRVEVALTASKLLLSILRRFGSDARTAQDARKLLLACGVPRREHETKLAELLQREILIPEMGVSTTALDPVGHFVRQLPSSGPTRAIRNALRNVRKELKSTQWTTSTLCLPELQRLARALPAVPGFDTANRVFQIETECRCPDVTISASVIASIAEAVRRLHFAFGDLRADRLTAFVDAFLERYGEATVPILQVLHPEHGILPSLLQRDAASRWPLRGRRQAMLRLLHAALNDRAHAIEIDDDFWDGLTGDPVCALPPAFSAVCTVLGASTADVDAGKYEVVLDSVVGSEGTELWARLGRFNGKARAAVLALHRGLDGADGDAIRADVLYAPLLGSDVAWRPGAHRYVIACSPTARSRGVQSIPLSDLHVQVSGGKVRVVSKRLGRHIMPQVGSAFDPELVSEPVLGFLLAVSQEGSATPLQWEWGDLATSPFLPRVRYRRVTLSPARWYVDRADIAAMPLTDDAATGRANWERWSAARRIPDLVAIRFGDDRLVFSPSHPLGLKMLHKEIARAGFAVMEEVRVDSPELCATGDGERHVHELVVPFVRAPKRAARTSNQRDLCGAPSTWSQKFTEGICLPGSEWLYTKLYASPRQIQAMLRSAVPRLVSELRRTCDVRAWFFFRYKDPDWHLRLRFRVVSKRLRAQAFGLVNDFCSGLHDDGAIWRVQHDTYYREIERFGGVEACRLVERIFAVESDMVLGALALSSADEAYSDAAMSLAIRWVSWTWGKLGLSLAECSELARRLAVLARQREVAERTTMARFATALKGGLEGVQARGSTWQPYARRAGPPLRRLATLAEHGSLSVARRELAGDLAHLLVNRLFASGHADAESALYRSLHRHWERTRRTHEPYGSVY